MSRLCVLRVLAASVALYSGTLCANETINIIITNNTTVPISLNLANDPYLPGSCSQVSGTLNCNSSCTLTVTCTKPLTGAIRSEGMFQNSGAVPYPQFKVDGLGFEIESMRRGGEGFLLGSQGSDNGNYCAVFNAYQAYDGANVALTLKIPSHSGGCPLELLPPW